MQFIIYTEDRDDGLPIRQSNRGDHLDWINAPSDVEVLAAGPWLDDDGTMRGSLLIVDAGNKNTVLEWLKHDPYAVAGLPKSVVVNAFKWVIGAPG
jgi:uncharacterized protein YciI